MKVGVSPSLNTIFSNQIVFIVGSLGSSINVESNPIHRMLLPLRSTQYDINSITILLVEMLFHNQFANNMACFEVCSNVLARLSYQKFFDQCAELFRSSAFADSSHQAIRLNYASFIEPGKFDVFEYLTGSEIQISLIRRPAADVIWDEELWNEKGRDYNDWLTTLCYCLLQYLLDFVKKNDLAKKQGIERHRLLLIFMSMLPHVCLFSVEMCEVLFPLLVYELIELSGPQSLTSNKLSEHIPQYLLATNASVNACKLGCNALVFLLRQNIHSFKNGAVSVPPSPSGKPSGSPTNNSHYSYFLNIDYQTAASAAHRCGLNSTALLLCELYAEQSKVPFVRSLISGEGDSSASLKSLVVPIYRSLNDPDMIEGLDHSLDLYLQAECYANKNQWLQAMSTYESLLADQHTQSFGSISDGMTRCFEGLGSNLSFNNSGLTYNKSSVHELNRAAERQLSSWDHTIVGGESSITLQMKTSAISKEFLTVTNRLRDLSDRSGGFSVLSKLCNECVSNAASAYFCEDMKTVSSNLEMMTDFAKLSLSVHESNENNRGRGLLSSKNVILDTISSQLSGQASNQAQLVNIRRPLSVLVALAKTKVVSRLDAIIPVKELCQGNAELCHKLSPVLYGFWREMEESRANESDHVLIKPMIDLQKSLLLWGKGLSDASIQMISNVIDVVSNEREVFMKSKSAKKNTPELAQYLDYLYAEAMKTKGVWLSKRGSIAPNDVVEKYLQPALEGCKHVEVMIESAYAIAIFSAEMFANLEAKVQSSEWKMSLKVLNHREIEYKQCLELKPADPNKPFIPMNGINIDTREFARHMNMLKKEIDMDRKERYTVEVSLTAFLKSALRHFGKVLQLQSNHSISSTNSMEGKVDSQDIVFRLVGLWLGNSDKPEANEAMGAILNDANGISSHFFVPLTYQILSRLGASANEPVNTPSSSASLSSSSSQNGAFDEVLKRLVLMICKDHPYHTLPQLFALINVTAGLSSQVVKGNISMTRKQAAEEIYHKLLAEGGDILKTTSCMEKFLQNYIDLAVASTDIFHKSGKCKGIKFSDVQARGKRFHELLDSYPIKPPILTKDIGISIRGQDYAANGLVTRIVEIPPEFNITENGISRPKIIICRGDDGKSYRQLVKSGDDMRQDAVMQQVFRTVNQILRRYESTRARRLNIRTYNVIPTNPQTGLLEWVENTAPFGMLLVDKDHGLHNRYGLNGWRHIQCRDHLRNAADNLDREKRYNEISANFDPVFRYFFLENFAHPFDWLHRRLAYSHSVAANSITGYILGIGDRHAFNILIDTITGEAVHIDFGIVFDQGKGLLTPETVPFRLTREIVDGMGITGCEGSFRRSCEEVLKVLRDNSSYLLTILEVIIHDPLYKWSLSPFEAQLKQAKQKEIAGGGEAPLKLSLTSPSPTPRKSSAKDGGSGSKSTGRERDRPPTPVVQVSGDGPAPLNIETFTPGAQGPNFGKDAAERTLMKIRNKLRGFENPTGEALGVESHVDLLINEARNPFNLCKIFPGWAPWL